MVQKLGDYEWRGCEGGIVRRSGVICDMGWSSLDRSSQQCDHQSDSQRQILRTCIQHCNSMRSPTILITTVTLEFIRVDNKSAKPNSKIKS